MSSFLLIRRKYDVQCKLCQSNELHNTALGVAYQSVSCSFTISELSCVEHVAVAGNPGLLLGTEAPVKTPYGLDFCFLCCLADNSSSTTCCSPQNWCKLRHNSALYDSKTKLQVCH